MSQIDSKKVIDAIVESLRVARMDRDAQEIKTAEGLRAYHRLRGVCIGLELAIVDIQDVRDNS